MTSCHSSSSMRDVGNHDTLDGEMKGNVSTCTYHRKYNTSATDDDDDDSDMDDDMGGRHRPDRPVCVPKIDLSWTHYDDDQYRNTHAPDHVTRDHVTQCGGRSKVVVKRRRRRHRRARHRTKRLHTNHSATYTSPLTPRTPRREIVRKLDMPEVENDSKKQELEIEETGSVQMNDEGVCSSNDDFNCETTTKCSDVIPSHVVITGTGRDVAFNCTSNASMMQYDADSPLTSSTTNMATERVEISHIGNTNEYADAEGLHRDVISPSSLTNITLFSAASETVRHHGGDVVYVDRKLELERESSPSVAERLACMLDCCHCCRLSLILYRRVALQSQQSE